MLGAPLISLSVIYPLQISNTESTHPSRGPSSCLWPPRNQVELYKARSTRATSSSVSQLTIKRTFSRVVLRDHCGSGSVYRSITVLWETDGLSRTRWRYALRAGSCGVRERGEIERGETLCRVRACIRADYQAWLYVMSTPLRYLIQGLFFNCIY